MCLSEYPTGIVKWSSAADQSGQDYTVRSYEGSVFLGALVQGKIQRIGRPRPHTSRSRAILGRRARYGPWRFTWNTMTHTLLNILTLLYIKLR